MFWKDNSSSRFIPEQFHHHHIFAVFAIFFLIVFKQKILENRFVAKMLEVISESNWSLDSSTVKNWPKTWASYLKSALNFLGNLTDKAWINAVVFINGIFAPENLSLELLQENVDLRASGDNHRNVSNNLLQGMSTTSVRSDAHTTPDKNTGDYNFSTTVTNNWFSSRLQTWISSGKSSFISFATYVADTYNNIPLYINRLFALSEANHQDVSQEITDIVASDYTTQHDDEDVMLRDMCVERLRNGRPYGLISSSNNTIEASNSTTIRTNGSTLTQQRRPSTSSSSTYYPGSKQKCALQNWFGDNFRTRYEMEDSNNERSTHILKYGRPKSFMKNPQATSSMSMRNQPSMQQKDGDL